MTPHTVRSCVCSCACACGVRVHATGVLEGLTVTATISIATALSTAGPARIYGN